MQPKILDPVIVTEDLSEHQIFQDDLGTIVECYTEPTLAYEVEFVRPDGSTKALITLLPAQLRQATKEEIRTIMQKSL